MDKLMIHSSLVEGWMACAGVLLHPSLCEGSPLIQQSFGTDSDLGDALCLLVMVCCFRFRYFNVPEVCSLVLSILSTGGPSELHFTGVKAWHHQLSVDPPLERVESLLCLKPPGRHSCALYIPEADTFCLNVAIDGTLYCPEHNHQFTDKKQHH